VGRIHAIGNQYVGAESVELVVHRSTNEIGGNCIELIHNGYRLLLDAGFPLSPEFEGVDPADVLPATLDATSPIAGLLISHAHLDHYGLINALPEQWQIWCGGATKRLIEVNSELFQNPMKHQLKAYASGKTFELGPFRITPHLTDHSAFDAHMLLIECDGKKVFYTGDFRIKGRKSSLVENLIKRPPSKIDVLLMEGTTLGRNSDYPSENDLEEVLFDHFKRANGRVFITWSAQNIDRTVTIYRACKRSQRTLAIDMYTAYILETLHQQRDSIPTLGWRNLKCMVSSARIRWFSRLGKTDFIEKVCVPNGMSVKKLQNHHEKWVAFVQPGLLADFQNHLIISDKDTWIYSMWNGYLKDNRSKLIDVEAWFNENGIVSQHIHTSGHASFNDLHRFAEALSPKQLVPIHSEKWDDYSRRFKNVRRLSDGEVFSF
jgi:ribonuclease J